MPHEVELLKNPHYPEYGEAVQFLTEITEPGDGPAGPREELLLLKTSWEELGSPDTVTVSVEAKA